MKKEPKTQPLRTGRIGDYLFLRKAGLNYRCEGDGNGKHDTECERVIKKGAYYIECRRYMGSKPSRGQTLSQACGRKYWGNDFYSQLNSGLVES